MVVGGRRSGRTASAVTIGATGLAVALSGSPANAASVGRAETDNASDRENAAPLVFPVCGDMINIPIKSGKTWNNNYRPTGALFPRESADPKHKKILDALQGISLSVHAIDGGALRFEIGQRVLKDQRLVLYAQANDKPREKRRVAISSATSGLVSKKFVDRAAYSAGYSFCVEIQGHLNGKPVSFQSEAMSFDVGQTKQWILPGDGGVNRAPYLVKSWTLGGNRFKQDGRYFPGIDVPLNYVGIDRTVYEAPSLQRQVYSKYKATAYDSGKGLPGSRVDTAELDWPEDSDRSLIDPVEIALGRKQLELSEPLTKGQGSLYL